MSDLPIFTNIIDNLKYVGKAGNANPHFISDWIEVELDDSVNSAAPQLGGVASQTCEITAALNIDFYTSKYGTEANPQDVISKVVISRDRLSWAYQQIDSSDTQSFPVYVNVGFFKVDQETETFIPIVEFPDILRMSRVSLLDKSVVMVFIVSSSSFLIF